MTEAIDIISEEERERVLARAENDPVFRDIARLGADLVDQYGYPERNVEAAFGDNRDVVVLFRMFRTAAMINRRLAGKPIEERLTATEWRMRDALEREKRTIQQMRQMANVSPLSLGQESMRRLPSRVQPPPEFESVISDSVLAKFGIAKPPPSGFKDRMRDALGGMVKSLTESED